jgi:hypothetical protein
MARKGIINAYRIKASSIIEVVIAMVLIVFVLGIALMIYTNVLRFSLSAPQIKAGFLLQQILIQEENKSHISDQHIQLEEFSVEEQLSPYINTGLIDIHLTAFDINHQKLAEVRKLIIKRNDQP